MRTIDYSVVGNEAGLEPVLREYALALLLSAADRLGVPVSELKKRLRIRLRPTDYSVEVNADVTRSGCVISVNEALFIFYHKMLKVFVCSFDVTNSKTMVVEKTLIPWERVVRVTDQLIRAFLEDRILRQGGFKLEELTDGQEAVSSLLREGCEEFAIRHELGHVVIGRTKGKVPEYSSARKEATQFLRDRSGLEGYKKRAVIESWTNELCADLIGLKLVLSLPLEEGESKHRKGWLAAGAIVTCLLRWMIEDYEVRLKKEWVVSITHPPEYLRAKYLNSFVSKEMPDEPNYSGYFFDYGVRVLKAIFPSRKAGLAD